LRKVVVAVHHASLRRRGSDPEITRDDVSSIMTFLMRIDEKVDDVRTYLIGEEDGEEDQEGS
jgi:hypothetical protein